MISLERLLAGLDVRAEPVVFHDIRRPGALGCVPAGTATMHYVLHGVGTLELAHGESVGFGRNSVIVLPARLRVRIIAAAAEPWTAAHGRSKDVDGDGVLMACLPIRATYQRAVGLFDHLRQPLVENTAADDPIRRSFGALLDEVDAQRPGARAMTETLWRECLILVLRRCVERGDGQPPWLTALEHEGIGRAIAAMEDRPEHSFSLLELAEVAAMSRSVFAARFTGIVGRSPIEFLKSLRLVRAAELLVRTDMPVKTVAGRVGYLSRSSFTRAFLTLHGVGPTAFRASTRERL